MLLKRVWIVIAFLLASLPAASLLAVSLPAFAQTQEKKTSHHHATHHKTTSHHEKKKETHTKHHASKHPAHTTHHHSNKKHEKSHTGKIEKTEKKEISKETKQEVSTPQEKTEKHHFLHHYHFHNPHLIKASMDFAHTTKLHLVDLVHRAISALHFSRYRFGGTYFNLSRGIYEVDCSDYVDHLLRMAEPGAYHTLVASTHTEKPTSADYFRFFKNLPENPISGWQEIDNVADLKPGAILVFRYSDENDAPGGHVMVVMDKPVPTYDGNAFAVRVSDSASSRHSNDTRSPHTSGIGIGTLMLKVDPHSGEPNAYAWTLNSGWKSIEAAMAEPVSE